jgi:hypothetical protein
VDNDTAATDDADDDDDVLQLYYFAHIKYQKYLYFNLYTHVP